MIIKSLELNNYRNYGELNIEFNSGTNLLHGDNAQGKTNILEAVYVCATTKSHRGSKDKEVIKFGRDEAHIKLVIEKKDICYRIDMHLKKNRPKGIAINGIPIRRASELFGIVNVVFFSPEDLNIIKNGPSDRRRFIDLELCQINKLYVHSLVSYNKILAQRNILLRQLSFHKGYEDALDVYDMQLVTYGKEIIKYRSDFIDELNLIIKDIHKKLSGEKEDIIIVYNNNIDIKDFENVISKNRESDIKNKTTLTGPHRDDINFIVNNIDIRKYGSQGQQRTAALSLKLSEIEIIKKKVNDEPILLLDDVLSELDAGRQSHLLKAINNIQTIITCTGIEDFMSNRFDINKSFKVIEGTVCEDIYLQTEQGGLKP